MCDFKKSGRFGTQVFPKKNPKKLKRYQTPSNLRMKHHQTKIYDNVQKNVLVKHKFSPFCELGMVPTSVPVQSQREIEITILSSFSTRCARDIIEWNRTLY